MCYSVIVHRTIQRNETEKSLEVRSKETDSIFNRFTSGWFFCRSNRPENDTSLFFKVFQRNETEKSLQVRSKETDSIFNRSTSRRFFCRFNHPKHRSSFFSQWSLVRRVFLEYLFIYFFLKIDLHPKQFWNSKLGRCKTVSRSGFN